MEKEPVTAEDYNNRGVAYYDKGMYDKAIENFTKAIELEPDFVKAYMYRGLAYKAIYQFYKSAAEFDKAEEIRKKRRNLEQ